MSAYIELANKSLEKRELAWPSRPKFHVPRFLILNESQISIFHLVREVQHLNILLVTWTWYLYTCIVFENSCSIDQYGISAVIPVSVLYDEDSS